MSEGSNGHAPGSGVRSVAPAEPQLGPRPETARARARRAAAVPFTMRRRQRSHGGAVVLALALLAGFAVSTFVIGYLVGRMLL